MKREPGKQNRTQEYGRGPMKTEEDLRRRKRTHENERGPMKMEWDLWYRREPVKERRGPLKGARERYEQEGDPPRDTSTE